MKWLLLLWGLNGPEVTGVFFDRAMCEALVDHPKVEELAAIRLCVPMRLDKLVSDVILYEPELERGQINVIKRSSDGP